MSSVFSLLEILEAGESTHYLQAEASLPASFSTSLFIAIGLHSSISKDFGTESRLAEYNLPAAGQRSPRFQSRNLQLLDSFITDYSE